VAATLVAAIGCAAGRAAPSSEVPAEIAAADSSVGTDAPGADSVVIVQVCMLSEQQFSESERFSLAQDHFIMARDYERRGIMDMAWPLYEIAYQFWPQSNFLRKFIIDRHIRAEEFQQALSLFREDEDPVGDMTNEDRRALSLIHLRLGNIAKAATAMEAVGDAMTGEEMYSLALLYNSIGDMESAYRAFRRFFIRRNNERAAVMGIRLVQISISERKFAEADSLAAILREAYPGSANVAALLGTVRYLGGDTASAVEYFNEALAIDSLNEEALRTLAHIHLVREMFPEAIVYYRRLTAQDDIAAPYRRGLAFLLFHTKEFAAAEKLLDTLIAEGNDNDLPGLQELHVYRGLIYSQTNRRDRAATEFRAAVTIDPKYEDAWKELCFLYILDKDTVRAHAAVEEYAAVFSESGTAWRLRGYVLGMRKDYDGAVAAFRRAIEIYPNDFFSHFELATILERQKRVDEAADAFRGALRIRPRDATTANNLGYMWADAGINLDSAKVLIELALNKEPNNGAYLDSYAWVFYRLGDYERALHYMDLALKDDGIRDEPVIFEHLGDIHFKLKNYAEAESAYRRALELKTKDAERVRERLAEIRTLMREMRR
jgi:tetratricopeptide (TPR) repeat protein